MPRAARSLLAFVLTLAFAGFVLRAALIAQDLPHASRTQDDRAPENRAPENRAPENRPQASQPADNQPAPEAGALVPKAILEAPFAPTANELFGHVAFLAGDRLKGRDAGSPEAGIVASYIAAEFQKLGLKPAGTDKSFEQSFSFQRRIRSATGVRVQTRRSRNVLAWLKGTDEELKHEYLLIGAHFDHLGVDGEAIYNGADDNASGIAGLLGIAAAFTRAKVRPRRSILFVAFGAEERGLCGSRYYVQQPVRPLSQLAMMFNLDMIGRGTFLGRKAFKPLKALFGISDGPGVGVLGGTHCPLGRNLARAVCTADGLPAYAPEDFPLIQPQIEAMTAGRADSVPFEARGIPILFLSTSEHDDYHRPTDTIDKLDKLVLRRVARAMYRTVRAVDARDERPPFVKSR